MQGTDSSVIRIHLLYPGLAVDGTIRVSYGEANGAWRLDLDTLMRWLDYICQTYVETVQDPSKVASTPTPAARPSA